MASGIKNVSNDQNKMNVYITTIQHETRDQRNYDTSQLHQTQISNSLWINEFVDWQLNRYISHCKTNCLLG